MHLTTPLLALSLVLASSATPTTSGADTPPVPVWPLEPRGEVVAGFDPPDAVWDSGHRGVDVSGTVGQQVLASRAGVVAVAGSVAGKPVLVVRHGGTRTTYEPVAATVQVGTPVTAGQPVGRLVVEHSHCFPAACLHWGLRRGEEYLDPLAGFPRGVRLLPDEPAAVRFAGATVAGAGGLLGPWRPVLGVWRPRLDSGA